MNNIVYNVEMVENYIKENKLTKKAFCEKCNISVTTLYKVLNNKNVYLGTIYRIAKVIHIELKNMFKDKKYQLGC